MSIHVEVEKNLIKYKGSADCVYIGLSLFQRCK